MIINKEVYVDLKEKYEKVKKLLDEDSKLDPPDKPYQSQCKAHKILLGMKTNLENLLKTPNDDVNKLTGMLGAVLLYLSNVSIVMGETSSGEKFLSQCQGVLEFKQNKREIILVALNMYNEFGLLLSEREPDKAMCYLEIAKGFYTDVKKDNLEFIDIHDLFVNYEHCDVELASKNLEKLHTLTLYYLAQIYGAQKEPLKSAVYLHNTLKRQLQNDDYEFIDWALNSATLAQFFVENNGFHQARHHLAASSYMLDVYETKLNEIETQNEEYLAQVENFKHRSADVARCWAKYGIILLSNSRDRLMQHSDDIDSNCTLSTDLGLSNPEMLELNFPTLNLMSYEMVISDQFVLTIEDARKVFWNCKSWLDKAHNYYTLENLASDYIQIIQDHAQLYLNLAFFEDNVENQAKMHKRRVTLYEDVLKQVNPTYYMQYCKKMWYELADAYSEILHIKLDKLKEMPRPTPCLLTKINSLIDSSIGHYNNFINAFKELSTNELPKRIESEYEKVFLLSYFNIAALHSRYISLDKNILLKHTKANLEAHNKVVDYCKINPEADKLIPSEIAISREMVILLPMKMLKLQNEIKSANQ